MQPPGEQGRHLLLGRQEAIDAPLAVAHEVTESVDGASRPSTHLHRVKEALLLYVNAKYVDHVSFTSLESKLMQLGVGARSVKRVEHRAQGPARARPAAAATRGCGAALGTHHLSEQRGTC